MNEGQGTSSNEGRGTNANEGRGRLRLPNEKRGSGARITSSGDSDQPIDKVAAYRFAKLIADAGWDDASALQQHPLLVGIAPQLVRALGSISANIAEGYARKSPRDRIRYYEYALGSVEESRSWFHVARRAIPPQTIHSRDNQLTSIRRLLLTMIANERRGHNWNSARRA